jgi:hypothetical protein
MTSRQMPRRVKDRVEASNYTTKYQAIAYIGMQTRFGRRIIESMMDKMEAEGKITFIKGLDRKSLLITMEDIQKIIDELRQYPR